VSEYLNKSFIRTARLFPGHLVLSAIYVAVLIKRQGKAKFSSGSCEATFTRFVS
jgi:hypothetical protein